MQSVNWLALVVASIASIETCKEVLESISDKISPNNLPDILKA